MQWVVRQSEKWNIISTLKLNLDPGTKFQVCPKLKEHSYIDRENTYIVDVNRYIMYNCVPLHILECRMSPPHPHYMNGTHSISCTSPKYGTYSGWFTWTTTTNSTKKQIKRLWSTSRGYKSWNYRHLTVGSSTLQDNSLAVRGWSLGPSVHVSNHGAVTTAQQRERIPMRQREGP